jgi:ferric enterobactin receptor
MKKFCLFLVAQFFTLAVSAQTLIKGSVADAKNQPVVSANILLMNAKGNAFVKAGISDENGVWSIENVAKGVYLVKIQFLGFQTYMSTPLSIEAQKTVEMPVISLKDDTQTLNTVEITYKKPFLEQRAGMMVVNIANSIAGSTGTLGDALKKVPGLLVLNGKVEIIGRPSVNIMIDGRTTEYMDVESLLRDLPADQIERVEVISQPDARFDAAGSGGIINIVLKKNVSLGINGHISTWVAQGDFLKYGTNASISRREKGLNLYASTSLFHNPTQETYDIKRQVGSETFSNVNYMPSNAQAVVLRGGVDYNFNKKHTVGFGVNSSFSTNNRLYNNQTAIFSANNVGNRFRTLNDIQRQSRNISGNVYYTFEMDTAGRKLEWSANIVNYRRTASNLLTTEKLTDFNFNIPTRRNTEPGRTQIFASRLDYTHPLSKNATFTTGLKISHADLDNNVLSSLQNNAEWTTDMGLTNHYLYKEDIMAAYLNSTIKFGKVEWQSGLRYEYTRSNGYSATLDSTLTRSYGQLFPSTSFSVPVMKIMGKQINAMAAYSYRINRPSYGTLNPFVRFLDAFTYERGNPTLKPELTHSGNLSLTFEGKPFFTLEYNRTNDAIQTVSDQNDKTRVTYGFDENIAKYTQFGGHLFVPLMFIKNLDGFAGVRIHRNIYESDYLGNKLDLKSTSFIAFLQANYKINKHFSTELGARYIKGGLRGLVQMGDLFMMDAAVKGKFFDNRLEVALSVDNPFSNFFDGKILYQNQNIDVVTKWEVKVVDLTLKYKFGNKFLKDRKSAKNSADEEMRRANSKN